jgi:ABC-type transport system substrate-binding protein
MKRRTALFALIVAALFVGTYSMWKQLNFRPIAPTTLRLSLDNEVESLDPAKAYSDDSLLVSSQVLEPLYQYHYLKRPYEVQPLLAENLPQLEEGGKVLVIRLKKNVFYHPHAAFRGEKRELRAEDFVLQFKRLAMETLKSPGRSLFTGLVRGFEEYGKAINEDWKKFLEVKLEGVEATDDHTLKIRLTKTEPNMIYYLAMNFVVPVPWEIISYYENRLDEVLIGTGPYIYSGYNDKYLEMQKNREYREDFYPGEGDRFANVQRLLHSTKERIPYIDTVRFYVNKEEERWEKFLNNEIDLLTVPKAFIPRLYDENGELVPELKKKNIHLGHYPMLTSRWFSFNMRDPLLGKNKNLRLAIANAIDYTEYLQVISQNTNLRANSILVPGIAGYRPARDFRFNYDPDKARNYLYEAGFTTPEKMPTVTYSTRGNEGIALLEAEFVKESLESIGLRVKIDKITFTEFLKKGRAGELQFFTDAWIFDFPDGENIMQLLVSSNSPGINKSGYSNPEVDRLYQKLKEETHIESRERILQDMEELVFEDLPWIPLMYESSFVLQVPKLKNFRKSSLIRNYVKYLKLE